MKKSSSSNDTFLGASLAKAYLAICFLNYSGVCWAEWMLRAGCYWFGSALWMGCFLEDGFKGFLSLLLF